jgi:hypothetical protein
MEVFGGVFGRPRCFERHPLIHGGLLCCGVFGRVAVRSGDGSLAKAQNGGERNIHDEKSMDGWRQTSMYFWSRKGIERPSIH